MSSTRACIGLRTLQTLTAVLAIAFMTTAAGDVPRTRDGLQAHHGIQPGNGDADGQGRVVVANRMSGTISVISTKTDQRIGTYALPPGDNPPEPMYVYATPFQRRVFVGDRANDRVVAFDAHTFEVVGTAETGRGVFHMWGSTNRGQLWVNCDVDNTTTVVDMRTLQVIANVPTPADLVALGGRPHDVIVSPDGFFAYVTLVGVMGDTDYVVQFDARTFEEIGRAEVGDDPHVSLTPRNRYLYVPAQNADTVHVLDRFTLESVTDIPVPGAHGAGMRINGRYLYTTNLPGGGIDALWAIDTTTNTVVGTPRSTPYAVPHNIAITPNGKKLYVTHSGLNDKVTIHATGKNGAVVDSLGEVTVGLNPFGIAYVP